MASPRLTTSRSPRLIMHPRHGVMVERFRPARRVEHLLVIATFVVLVVTGLPQKFYDMHWAAATLRWLGGLDDARFIHRIAGLVFFGHVMAHIGAIVAGVFHRRMRLSMLPVPQDLRDAWQTLRHYFGRRDRPPALPIFDYRQKFEYIGLVLGGLVMIVSGFILMYPNARSNSS